jgi:hypothetical protein
MKVTEGVLGERLHQSRRFVGYGGELRANDSDPLFTPLDTFEPIGSIWVNTVQ